MLRLSRPTRVSYSYIRLVSRKYKSCFFFLIFSFVPQKLDHLCLPKPLLGQTLSPLSDYDRMENLFGVPRLAICFLSLSVT